MSLRFNVRLFGLVVLFALTPIGCSGSSGTASPPPAPVTGKAALAGSWQASELFVGGVEAIALGSVVALTLDFSPVSDSGTWLFSVANDSVGLCEQPIGCVPSGQLLVGNDSEFLFDPGTSDEIAWTYTASTTELIIAATLPDGTSILGACVRTSSPPAPALLAYEGFDYPTGSDELVGRDGGVGWQLPWEQIGAEGALLPTSLEASGLSAGLRTVGRATRTQPLARDGRRLDLAPSGAFATNGYLNASGDVGADGKTLYISFLQQSTTPDFFWEFEFKRDDILTDGGRIAGIGNNASGGSDVNLRAPSDVFSSLGPADTAVNFWVVRIDFQPGLDSVFVYRNPPLVVEPDQADLALVNQADMSFDAFTLGSFVSSGQVSHDETTGSDELVGRDGGVGWQLPWEQIGAEGALLPTSLEASGLSAGLRTVGRATRTQPLARDGRRLDLAPSGAFATNGYLNASGDVGADGKTLYISFLQQSTTPDFFWEFEFKRDDILTDGGRIAGIGNNASGGSDVNLRAPSDVFSSLGPADTAVNFWVVRIDFQPGLDSVFVYRNPPLVVEPDQADLALVNQADMSFDAFTLGSFVSSGQVSHDEIRIGPSYASVALK